MSFTDESQKKFSGDSFGLVQTNTCKRPQTELPLAERKTNLEDAFSALEDIRGKNILLLDDVMTSGSMLNAAERFFKVAVTGIVGASVLYSKMWDSQN